MRNHEELLIGQLKHSIDYLEFYSAYESDAAEHVFLKLQNLLENGLNPD